MTFLLNVTIFVLRVLIAIGDIVILLFNLAFNIVKTAFFLVKERVKDVKNSIFGLKNIFKIRKIKLRLPRVKISLPKISIKSPFRRPSYSPLTVVRSFEVAKKEFKRTKRIKPLKPKTVTVFPLPAAFKFKYFFFGLLFFFIFIFIPFGIYSFLQSLPNPKQLSEREIPQTTKIFDRNGNLLYQIYVNQNRTLIPLSSVPKNLINATIAIEDKDFYRNPGFDFPSIVRAAIADASGKPVQGGSTITQQLIKSTLLTPEVSITRKIKEIVLAFWAERIYSKNEILEMYLNQVAYGGTSWGIEAASEVYFGKKASDLDLAQCAFLAGMPQAPSDYSPYGENPNLWKKRQKEVLDKMQKLSYITKQQEDEALSEQLIFQSPQTPIYAPHFVMYVKDYLIQKYGLPLVEKGGLNVVTSLDLKTQQMAENVVRNEVNNDAYLNLTNGAALITNPSNGDILAMVGSKDYDDPNGGNVNLTTALRQPGSSIKVVTYSAALTSGFTAATILDDSPVTYVTAGSTPYSPVNYDGKFHGHVPLRIALANSFNIPAVKTLQKIGVPQMMNLAKDMGITTWKEPSDYGLAITLGAAEVKMTDMATVYGTLANEGEKIDLDPILKITDYKGDMIYSKGFIQRTRVLDKGIAFIMSNILSDNQARSIEFGTNSPLNIPGHTVSVKTGTTDNKRDNWTFGYTPNTLVAVWVGNNDNSPMSQNLASGITGAAPIFHAIMENLLNGKPDQKMAMPGDVVQKTCYGKPEYFIKGTENLVNCNFIATPSATVTP